MKLIVSTLLVAASFVTLSNAQCPLNSTILKCFRQGILEDQSNLTSQQVLAAVLDPTTQAYQVAVYNLMSSYAFLLSTSCGVPLFYGLEVQCGITPDQLGGVQCFCNNSVTFNLSMPDSAVPSCPIIDYCVCPSGFKATPVAQYVTFVTQCAIGTPGQILTTLFGSLGAAIVTLVSDVTQLLGAILGGLLTSPFGG